MLSANPSGRCARASIGGSCSCFVVGVIVVVAAAAAAVCLGGASGARGDESGSSRKILSGAEVKEIKEKAGSCRDVVRGEWDAPSRKVFCTGTCFFTRSKKARV